MAGKLITLPLRVGLKSARLLTHLAGEAAGRAVSLAGHTLSRDRSGAAESTEAAAEPPLEPSPPPAPPPPPPPETAGSPAPLVQPPVAPDLPRVVEERAPVTDEPAPVTEAPAPIVEEPAPVTEEPAHVSEEPELVREEAEPGAEDGAGAQLTVAEPWNGYARLSARDVIARARQADAAELAAVRLYESRHRSRQTVLDAVDRQLKLGNGTDRA